MRQEKREDRHLQKRPDGGYRYVRRIPERALDILRRSDPDQPAFARRSLDTSSREEARAKRDAMEAADDDFWARLESEAPVGNASYQRALARAKSMRLRYVPVEELASDASVDELLRRIAAINTTPDRVTFDAALGAAGETGTSIDDAFKVFETEIRKQDMAKKSPWQRLKWRQLKQRGIANFKAQVGDIAIEQITREHANKFYKFWLDRIVPDDEDVEPTHSASAGNKDMDSMRTLVGEYLAHIGREDIPNPFRKLRFSDDEQRSRPAFSTEWLRENFLKAGALAGLNTEARLALLALVNTGARPSEVVNLQRDAIVLEANIPYIDIRAVLRGADRRALKNRATVRRIPLVGVSLEAMREAALGFPSYRDNDNLSATVNKFLRENELMETADHTLYSLRHGFEARLKRAEVDEELRRYLMGHSIKRPKYGYSDDLQWALAAISKIAL